MGSSANTLPDHDIEKVFRRFDTNGDGKISASELLSVVRALGTDASPEDARRMMEEMDTDRDGFVDLSEFSAFFSRHGGDAEDDSQLMDAFRMYDVDGDGRISVRELHMVMRRLGDKCSEKDCARMIRNVDEDGDGSVDFQEFKRMMTNNSTKKD